MKQVTMRFLAAIMVICVMSLGGFACAEADEGLTLEIGRDFMYAVSSDRVWVLTDGQVTIYDGAMKEEISSFALEYENVHLAASDAGLFISRADTVPGQIEQRDETGAVIGQWTLPEDANVLQIEVSDANRLVYLSQPAAEKDDEAGHEDENAFAGEVYVLSLTDGSASKLEGAEMISSISVGGSAIAACSYINNEIMLFDRESLEMTGRFNVSNTQYAALTRDDKCYTINSNYDTSTISYENFDEGKQQTVYEFEGWYAGLRIANEYIYTSNYDNNCLEAHPVIEPEAAERVFTIGCMYGKPDIMQFRNAVKKTQKEFPDVKIEYAPLEVSDEFTASLMAGDTGCDVLIYFNLDGVGARDYYRAGAFADLSKYPRIMAAYDQLIDIKSLFSADGGVYGVPHNEQQMQLYRINKALFEKYNLEIPADDWTWDDFFALGEQVKALRQSGEEVYLLLDRYAPSYLLQYNVNSMALGSIDYYSETFTSGLEKWKAATNDGLIRPMMYDGTDDTETCLMSYFDYGIHSTINYYTQAENAYFITMPKLDEGTKHVVQPEMAVMLSGTQNEDIAEAFLANCISVDVLSYGETAALLGILTKDISLVPLDGLLEQEAYAGEEMEARWRDWMENSVDMIEVQYMYEQEGDWYTQYLNGDMSLDQFLAQSQERADMALGE